MKNLLRLHLFTLATIFCVSAGAYDFELDGIYYNILSLEEKTVQVTVGEKLYEGRVTIPPAIRFANKKFVVTEIEDGAFSDCGELLYIEVPNSVKRLNNFCHNCPKLTDAILPEGLELMTLSFHYCQSLKSINLPETLKDDFVDNFHFCHALASVEVPRNVRSVTNSFRDCTSIEWVIISTRIVNINNSFRGCKGIKSVIPLNTTPIKVDVDSPLGLTSFDGLTKATATLYVPLEGLLHYKKDAFWCGFSKIRVLEAAMNIQTLTGKQ